MATSVEEFLKKIGPRKLTDAEARELQLLRLKEGRKGNTGVVDILSGKAGEKDKT